MLGVKSGMAMLNMGVVLVVFFFVSVGGKVPVQDSEDTDKQFYLANLTNVDAHSKTLIEKVEKEGYREEPSPVLAAPSSFVVMRFKATVLVNDQTQPKDNKFIVGESYNHHEDTLKLRLVDKQNNVTKTCSSAGGGFGFSTQGVQCKNSRNLPQQCFCWDGKCPHPYLPLSSVLFKLVHFSSKLEMIQGKADLLNSSQNNTEDNQDDEEIDNKFDEENVQQSGDDGVYFKWSLHSSELSITTILKLIDNRFLFPLDVYIKGFGYSLGSKADKAVLHYSVLQFQPDTDLNLKKEQGALPWSVEEIQNIWGLEGLDHGIFCPRLTMQQWKLFPEFPNQFSVKIETIVKGSGHVSYSDHHYDLDNNIVSVKFAPRLHTPPSMFLTTVALNSHLLPESYNMIHDFNAGLQYIISDRTGNCSVGKILPEMSDAAWLEGKKVRIKHAKELLEVNPSQFVYTGKRYIRGVLADVWTAEKLGKHAEDVYGTIELFFSDSDWTLQVEEVNEIKNVPLGMATYKAKNKKAAKFDSEVLSHYFDFNAAHPPWKLFDISSCLSKLNRFFLKITLQVSYGQLVQFSLTSAQESVRTALAGVAKVSPLRVADIFFSSSAGGSDLDVWFVLLDRPSLDGFDSSSANEEGDLNLEDSYQRIVAVVKKSDSQIKLYLGANRKMVVKIFQDSLEMVQEAVHPASRGRSYRFLRATYTAGSMAGLGFSMAVLGMCIGIFVGFLLWKRRLGIPYHLGS